MIIRSLVRYQGDLELRWLNGLHDHTQKGQRIKAQFLNHNNGLTIFEDLPFGMLPFLTPGIVVSRGEVQIARRTGQQASLILPDLSKPDDIDVTVGIAGSHYNLDGYRGGEQRILRYQSGTETILIPAIELIRFLFLHCRLLAVALLQPSGLSELAVTPLPGLHPQIQIDFTRRLPRKLLTPEFVREFAWLSVHPDGRRSWDSVRRRSDGEQFLTFDPPPLQNCRLEFRGVESNRHWLVLEILSLTGRVLPAESIRWTHPTECEKQLKGNTDGDGHRARRDPGNSQPRRLRKHVVNGDEESPQKGNQEALLFGGKRGCFNDNAEVVKILRPRRNFAAAEANQGNERPRKVRSDVGQSIDMDLPPVVVRQPVSIGNPALTGGLPPVEFAVLEPAERDHIGNLNLLDDVLRRIEAAHKDLTVTRSFFFLERGKAISSCGQHRRACLIALFAFPNCPYRVLIDVDHTSLDGLAALLLRYHTPTPLANVAKHVKMLLSSLVDNYGHWDNIIEAKLSKIATIKRLPKLLRMTDRAEQPGYVEGWMKRLNEELLMPLQQDLWLMQGWTVGRASDTAPFPWLCICRSFGIALLPLR